MTRLRPLHAASSSRTPTAPSSFPLPQTLSVTSPTTSSSTILSSGTSTVSGRNLRLTFLLFLTHAIFLSHGRRKGTKTYLKAAGVSAAPSTSCFPLPQAVPRRHLPHALPDNLTLTYVSFSRYTFHHVHNIKLNYNTIYANYKHPQFFNKRARCTTSVPAPCWKILSHHQ